MKVIQFILFKILIYYTLFYKLDLLYPRSVYNIEKKGILFLKENKHIFNRSEQSILSDKQTQTTTIYY